ncbi:transmembrane protein [Ninomys virus]|nr:transmembrane protein [Ninomys virus]
MPSEYDDPANVRSSYGSMRGSSLQYKASHIRRTPQISYTRSIRGIGSSIAERRGINLYFGFIAVLLSIILAVSVYIVITLETRIANTTCKITTAGGTTKLASDSDMEQVVSSVNTMMHSITYTLPQVLTSNRHAIVSRMNHMIYEIKEIVRLNTIDFNVKFNANKSVVLRTGQNSKLARNPNTGTVIPTYQTRLDPITLVPRSGPNGADNLPISGMVQNTQMSHTVTKREVADNALTKVHTKINKVTRHSSQSLL